MHHTTSSRMPLRVPELSEGIGVGRNKTIQARSARWRFRRIWMVFAGNAGLRCRSNRLISAYGTASLPLS